MASGTGLLYAYRFDGDILRGVNHGDTVELQRAGDRVTLRVVART